MEKQRKEFHDSIRLAVETVKMSFKLAGLTVVGIEEGTGMIIIKSSKAVGVVKLDPRVFNEDIKPEIFHEKGDSK